MQNGFLALIMAICTMVVGGHVWSAATILSNRKGKS